MEKTVELNQLGLALADYKGKPSTLCPGCGHNAISNQIQAAVWELGIAPEKIMKISGIGCSSKSPNYFLNRSFGFNGLHGRMPTLATGASFGDTSIKIIGISGDGDTASIGMGHFKHVIRRNVPMVYIIENNGCYGLTKGQASPTSPRGFRTSVQVDGVHAQPFNPLATALVQGAGFVARAYAGDVEKTKDVIKEAVQYKGYALVDIFQPCVSFNSVNTYAWFKENTYWLDGHDPSDFSKALSLALSEEPFPLGVLFRGEERTTFEGSLAAYRNDKNPLFRRAAPREVVKKLLDGMCR